MSELEPVMRAYMLGGAEVSSQVGTRVYPQILPQSPTLPAVTYLRVSTRRRNDLKAPDKLPRTRIQLSIWAASDAAAATAATVIRKRLDGFQGFWNDVEVQSCICVDDHARRDDETGRIAIIQDYMIQYVEA